MLMAKSEHIANTLNQINHDQPQNHGESAANASLSMHVYAISAQQLQLCNLTHFWLGE